MPDPATDPLFAEIDRRRGDLIALTQDLIRIPTLNPPGRHYREICDYLDARLSASGFTTELIRARGSPGDSDDFPRWNIVARHEGSGAGIACISTRITMWSRSAMAGRLTPLARN